MFHVSPGKTYSIKSISILLLGDWSVHNYPLILMKVEQILVFLRPVPKIVLDITWICEKLQFGEILYMYQKHEALMS